MCQDESEIRERQTFSFVVCVRVSGCMCQNETGIFARVYISISGSVCLAVF